MEILYPKLLNYREEKFHEVRDVYEGLAQGQSPGSLLVTCSDSRLSPQEFTQSQPGEIFVVRSAGNMINPYCSENVGSDALSLEYGVVALGVKEIVVCGHVACGAMAGIMNVDQLGHMPLVQKSLSDYRDRNLDEIKYIKSVEELTQWNVRKQLEHLYSYPFVKERVQSGKLHIWGWVFDFVNHQVVYKKNFLDISEVESA